MSKGIKEIIELLFINVGMIFLMFFPERSSIMIIICFGLAMIIFDVLFILSAFKYKCNDFNFREHKVLSIVYYFALILIVLAFVYLLLESWIF